MSPLRNLNLSHDDRSPYLQYGAGHPEAGGKAVFLACFRGCLPSLVRPDVEAAERPHQVLRIFIIITFCIELS